MGEVGFHGLQPGSVYHWEKLVSIQNKSAETLEVTLNLIDGAAISSIAVVGGTDNNNWFSPLVVWDNGVATPFTLGPNTTIDLEVTVTVPVGQALGTYTGTLVVDAFAK